MINFTIYGAHGNKVYLGYKHGNILSPTAIPTLRGEIN
jgi:hypothetical protein